MVALSWWSLRVRGAIGMQIPVLVSDLDLECQLWLKIRLAPMTPYFGTISLAFVGPPTIKVQLLPYNRVRLMRVPVVQVCWPVLLYLYHVHAASHGQVIVRYLRQVCSQHIVGSHAINFGAMHECVFARLRHRQFPIRV